MRSLFALCLIVIAAPAFAADAPVSFSRDVLPVLSDHCFACHGPDESHRKANLRLDTREGALAALSLEKPLESELLLRVASTDPQEVMPPPNSHKKRLTAGQVATLQRWVAAGAPWGKHWAFEMPVKATLPAGSTHPVDAFVFARLRAEGLSPSVPALRYRLARRVSLDLLGLPPTPEQVDEFVHNDAPDAFEKLVDRCLASEHFGERMAMWWLDAARYADTDGFQGDDTRTNWPWRDWVVDAFNRNLPFDQFTIEQFAGDLLPNATAEQKLATCFHRNHMTNGEGGRDPEESRIDYVIDRVNTTGALWLGLTLGCCQCHSHKYDPITQRDYYALNAFFNSIDEDGKAGRAAKPYLAYESPHVARAIAEAQRLVDERRELLESRRKTAEIPFATWLSERVRQVQRGYQAWRPITAATLESSEGTQLVQDAEGIIQAGGPNPKQDDYRVIAPRTLPPLAGLTRLTGLKLEVFPHATHTAGGLSRGSSGYFTLTDIKVQVRSQASTQVRDILVASAIADHSDDTKKHNGYGDIKHVLDDDPRNGWSTRDVEAKLPHTAVFALAEPLTLRDDEELVFELRHRSTLGDANIGRFRVSITDQPGPAVQSLEQPPLEGLAAVAGVDLTSLDDALRSRLREQFLTDYPPVMESKLALERAERQLSEAVAAKKVDVMVLAELGQPRPTQVLVRGVWDKKGELVQPDVPPAIAPWRNADAEASTQPRSRLGFARWLVSRDNPLTARVVVNHVWQLLFGAGLVRTPEDFGLQGERPTHPELLDWLAVDLIEHGWDLKRLVRQIVTSATYQQDSAVSPALLARDPDNRLLARGARFRLPSWMLRDAALQSAGLLHPVLGGPPVRPYQPAGVWEEMFMGRFKYEPSEGVAQYRRTLYAFWRRAIAPTFLFDSAQRRVCEVRQSRTNTPLQALTLLNDPNYLAASRALARHAMQAGTDRASRLSEITRRVLSRASSIREYAVLTRELERALDYYRTHPAEAEAFLRSTDFQRVEEDAGRTSADAAELAAYTIVASLTLNFDEALNHE